MKWRVEFVTHLSLTVEVDAPDEAAAQDFGTRVGARYLESLTQGTYGVVTMSATLDGIEPESVTTVDDPKDQP